jgi:hypothetical protein
VPCFRGPTTASLFTLGRIRPRKHDSTLPNGSRNLSGNGGTAQAVGPSMLSRPNINFSDPDWE